MRAITIDRIMKPKLILCLALVLSGGWFGCSAIAQNSAKPNQWQPFEIIPAITNANPAIREKVQVKIPTRFKIERTADTLTITLDANSLETTNLMVGKNMVTGIETEFNIYGVENGQIIVPSKSQENLGLQDGLDFGFEPYTWHSAQDGIPMLGTRYVVEENLKIFETDIPAQHMWNPQSKNYKVLWQRTLKQNVE
jgi:hypothetical protein